MENDLYYQNAPLGGVSNQQFYLNIARDLSRINSKNEEVTTRDGHVYGYLCNFKVSTADETIFRLFTAPNSWKMRNAFRKFHAYRDLMFDQAGIDKSEMGKYGRTIRPYLDIGDASGGFVATAKYMDSSDPSGATSEGEYDVGEWTHTQLATTPIYTQMATIEPEVPWADNFDLHICEENQVSLNTTRQSGYYTSVGMIHSYNLDRMEVVTPTTAETLSGPTNPLAALIASGNQATGEVIEIAKDQELETPPYDIADDGDSIQCSQAEFGVMRSTGGTFSFNAFLPAGLARVNLSADVDCVMQVEVLGRVLCKDMA
ncbi:MAG: hypothetical protein [Circular genetic element sp.]|nr:MAG: hypothetical protein [Circular genetic element sp.]